MTTKIGSIFGKVADPRTHVEDKRWPIPNCYTGLELEFEKAELKETVQQRLNPTFIEFWKDNSLRGNNVELRFILPLYGADLTAALDELKRIVAEFYRLNGYTLALNARTSAHVHLDVRDLTVEQFRRLKMLGILFEKVLFHYCAPEREYNNFCLPTYRAEGLRDAYNNVLVGSDDLIARGVKGASKYTGMNFLAVQEHGSIEFRHHQGTLVMEEIAEWISIIQCLKKAACAMNFTTINELGGEVSRTGPSVVAKNVFGELWAKLDYPDADVGMLDGIRFIQDLVLYRTLLPRNTGADELAELETVVKAKANK